MAKRENVDRCLQAKKKKSKKCNERVMKAVMNINKETQRKCTLHQTCLFQTREAGSLLLFVPVNPSFQGRKKLFSNYNSI